MRFFRRNARIITVLAALAAMIFLNAWSSNNPTVFAWLERGVSQLGRPFASILAQLSGYVTSTTDYIYEIKDTQAENTRLKKQLSELRREVALTQELTKENERLLALLALQDTRSFETIAVARVTAMSSYDGADQFILINKGSKDGITKDMAVMTLDGLVGRVVETSTDTSKIKLITDPLSSVGCLVQRSRSSGIAKGQGYGTIALTELTRESDVKKGDLIVTSGLGVIFPSGIPVARVTSVEKKEMGLFHDAQMQTVVDFNRLEEVAVVRANGYELVNE